jgi:DNA-binding NtrC family response regulator
MFAISVPIGEAVFDLTVKSKTPDPISNKLTDAIILCIDDDKNILDAMTELLSIWQCDVRTATNNKDWRDALNGTAPDIILADIHLGKSINGLNLVEEILLSFGRPIPAIIISADQNEKLILEVSHKGYSILPKPVKPAALRALMTRLLTTSKQHVN